MLNKNRNILFALFVSIMLLVSACENNRCFHGTGKESFKEVDCKGMEILDVKGLMHIILVDDSSDIIKFEGGENVLKFIETNQDSTRVTITNNNSCFFLRDYSKVKAYVHSSVLHEINLFETCKLEGQGTLTQNLFISVQGDIAEIDIEQDAESLWCYNNATSGGSYTFRGSVEMCNIEAYYTAKVDLKGLKFRYGDIENSSISDLYINPSEKARIKIHNKGNIYYSGSPEIIIDSITGTGKLLKWE